MGKWTDVRSIVIAVAFLAIGFLAAERMTPAVAASPREAQEMRGDSFAGTTGTTIVKTDRDVYVILVRDRKIYRIGMGKGGEQNQILPWAILAD